MKNNKFPVRGWSAFGRKPISISLSPNVQKDDVHLALKTLLKVWHWKKGREIIDLEEQFKKYLGVKYAYSFNSGRSALFAILIALRTSSEPQSNSLPKGKRVLLQAFTCNAVPNPILWADLNPVYIDCGSDFNIDIEDLKRKIKPHDVVIVQHTFGLPANMQEIMQIAEENDAIVIEDCAHALGAQYKDFSEINEVGLPTEALAKVGTIGKAGFFSFSRDKVISCVYVGMAVTNDDQIGKKLQELQKQFGYPTRYWICQQLCHPIALQYVILPLYNFFDLGKIFLVLSQWFYILSKAVSWKEKRGLQPNYFPKALPSALAKLALHQFKKIDIFNIHRKKITDFYFQELANTKFGLPSQGGIFLRFSVQHPKAHEIIYEAWHAENILLGDWYTTPIAPADTNMEDMRYTHGMCPKAERLAKVTLNLPTHINISLQPRSGQAISDAQRIVQFLKKYSS